MSYPFDENRDLFNRDSLSNILENRLASYQHEIEEETDSYLLGISQNEYIAHLYDKHHIDKIELLEDKINAEQNEIQMDVTGHSGYLHSPFGGRTIANGIEVIVTIPFNGEPGILYYRPNTHILKTINAKLNYNEILLSIKSASNDPAQVKQAYESDLSFIKAEVAQINGQLEEYNKTLTEKLQRMVSERKARLTQNHGIVAALGIPLKKRDNMPTTYAVPEVRRKPNIARPQTSTKSYKLEPALADAEYEDILKIIKSMVSVMEKSPKAFENMGEEDLRTHFLVQLNGQYEGAASGETFNYEGKTDILIKSGDKNTFIAECKFWDGKKILMATIDQILNYLSWRDTKAAILIFNRNKNFTKVLGQIEATVKKHPNFKKILSVSGTTFRYIFKQNQDEDRDLTLTIEAFDIPKKTNSITK